MPATITTRVLPPSEWNKIRHIPPFDQYIPDAGPDHWQPLVVEIDGEIVGCCSLFDTLHWDCWWVDRDHPEKAGIFWALVEAGDGALRNLSTGIAHVLVPDDRPDLQALVERCGFEPVQGRLFYYHAGQIRKPLRGST